MPFRPPVQEKCPVCDKSVYANEARLAAGRKFHTFCFKCTDCKKLLQTTDNVEHDGMLFCKQCHGKNFGTRGYGFGVGAGCMSTEGQDTNLARPGAGHMIAGAPVEGGCPRCGRRVYDAEKKKAGGKDWHQSCFNCAHCHTSLDSTKLNEKDGEVFCRNCYSKSFGPIGKI